MQKSEKPREESKKKGNSQRKKKGPLLNNSQNAKLLGRGRYGI